MPDSKRQSAIAGEIPEELIVTGILLKITDGACIGRYRCVCRSWGNLLSGTSLIRHHKLLLSPDSSSSSSYDHQIMITGVDDKWRRTYSLHSAETLEPLLQTRNYSTTMLLPSAETPEVVGCCNGLLCLSSEDRDGLQDGLILWNPATSETKALPPPSNPPHYTYLDLLPVGFGFDSETNDYKVFRQLQRDCSGMPRYLMEVYSLREDSWRVLQGSYPRLLHWPIPTYHKGKLYWRQVSKKSLRFNSIDISSEAFERVDVPCPVGVSEAWHRFSGFSGFWFNEESMVAQFPFNATRNSLSVEIWMLMQCWVPESWVKLYVITPPLTMRIMELTGSASNLTCFFTGNKEDGHQRIIVYDLETREFNDLEIEGQTSLRAIIYMPSQVSLRE